MVHHEVGDKVGLYGKTWNITHWPADDTGVFTASYFDASQNNAETRITDHVSLVQFEDPAADPISLADLKKDVATLEQALDPAPDKK